MSRRTNRRGNGRRSGRSRHRISDTPPNARQDRAPRFKDRSELEKFIGENLISKIGIVVLIIGVGIGAKYAIDQGWITPLMRIIFGYAVGFALLGTAVKLKPKYHNFSAVLLSGGMAIMYFITYFAYSLYALVPQPAAFVLMVMFTVFTALSAIVYNRQVIAHVGLVGAYAVPFLLSNNSGNYAFLFTYMALINAGILAISVKKYWKPLGISAFAFTWLIFGGWFAGKYNDNYFFLALLFNGIFFATFYLVTIVQHRLFEARTGTVDLALTILNTIIFYGFGFAIMDQGRGYSRYSVLFSYLAAFTLGILIISIRDYRRPLLYVSFIASWLTFFVWFREHYRTEEHFSTGWIFLSLFFAIFYFTALIHSRILPKLAAVENILPILTNSFLFFGIGYAMLDERPEFAKYMGLYTVANAGFHFLFAVGTTRIKSFPAEITYLLAGLVITFCTIAVPIQFDGNAITLVWTVEGAVLFAIGRMKRIRLYEAFSYPLMALASFSLVRDWINSYADRDLMQLAGNPLPIANGIFITAIVYIAAFAAIYYINRDERYETAVEDPNFRRLIKFLVAGALIFVLYNTFRFEISNYFNYESARIGSGNGQWNFLSDLARFNVIGQIDYSLLFLGLLGFVNIRRLKSLPVAAFDIAAATITLAAFCTAGLFMIGQLRGSYLYSSDALVYNGAFHIAARYISLACAGAAFFVLYRYTKQQFLQHAVQPYLLTLGFDVLFYSLLLGILSSELVSSMDLAGFKDSYKIGLSVLWGVYAVFLVGTGIYFKKRHLRIGAIALFGVTLAKLFLYDIAQLSTVAKTVVFVSVGVLMLIVSFLYTKYKAVIFGADEELPG